jgi:SAM-dependent methyltransferase
VLRWAHQVRPGGTVLDIAGGAGRHAILLAQQGHAVTLIDRDPQAIQRMQSSQASVHCIEADIENAPWPLPDQTFDAVLVTNYLWRPLLPRVLHSLNAQGVLIYETFSQGNECYGKPSNPNFLLRSGELLDVCKNLHIVAFEEVFLSAPDRCMQRIVAKCASPLKLNA